MASPFQPDRIRALHTRLAYLMSRPHKVERIRNRIRRRVRPFDFVYLEICGLCNLECVMCPRFYSEEKLGVMEDAVFEQVRRQILPHVTNVMIRGLGEPLLHKQVADVVAQCKASGATVTLTTNGMLLSAETSRRLLDAGLDALHISLDGCSRETYETIRKKGDFRRVVTNIVELQALRRHRGVSKPDLFLAPVLTRQNLAELPYYVAFAKSLGALGVAFSNPSVWTQELEDTIPLYPLGDLSEIRSRIREAQEAAARLRAFVVFPELEERPGPCTFGVDRNIVVTWDGDIRPCCHLFHSTESIVFKGDQSHRHLVRFGNLLEQDFQDIWQNPEYVRFRSAVNRRAWPPACKHCLVPHGL